MACKMQWLLFLTAENSFLSSRHGSYLLTTDLLCFLHCAHRRKHYDSDFEDDETELTKERLLDFRSAILHYIDFCQKQDFTKLKKLKTEQSNLPIAQYKKAIVKAVQQNQVSWF